MGVTDVVHLSRKEAAVRIDTLMDTAPQEEWSRLYERQGEWLTERFILYPDLYSAEFQRYLDEQLPHTLHEYVRSRVTGASELLTKTKIRKVIHVITTHNREWWRTTESKELFFDKLRELFPGCCDGGSRVRSPTQGPKVQQQRFSLFDHSTLESLFSHYAEFCEPWELTFTDGAVDGSPHDLLLSLDADLLTHPITQFHSGSDGTSWTIARQSGSTLDSRKFVIAWHPERHGWADSGPGSRSVHYFVPRGWLKSPLSTKDGMLVSLCQKSWLSNNSPFYPVDPRRTFCPACISHHEHWNRHDATDATEPG